MTKKTETKEKAEVVEAKKPIEETAVEAKEIRVIERVIENKEIMPADAFGKLTRPQIDLIKRTIAKGASDDELKMFIQVCKGAQLNPFMKQVHLVPRWDSREGKETRTIQVSIDGFRAIAESSGHYAGNDDPVFEGEQEVKYTGYENKKPVEKKMMAPLKATVTVWKMVEGHRYGFTATARWPEYYPGAKTGFQWHIRPYTMLGKCAEALALRKAFPKLLSGMYAQEEMDQANSAGADQVKTQKAMDTIMEAVKKANLKQLQEYKVKIEKSDKYDEDKKMEILSAVDARINELTINQNANA